MNIGNQMLATASSAVYQAMAMRQADMFARADLQAARAKAGADSTVTVTPRYAIGPDGSRYLTGGSVSTSRRSGEIERLPPPLYDPEEELALLMGRVKQRPATLADILGNKLSLSPVEFAQAFGEEFGDDLVRGRLQVQDRAVRSQELQHYRAAGGLIGGLPNYILQEGPDGEFYAAGGEVRIHPSSLSSSPKAARDAATQATAATAPGDASAQDMRVARQALSRSAEFWRQAYAPPSTLNLVE